MQIKVYDGCTNSDSVEVTFSAKHLPLWYFLMAKLFRFPIVVKMERVRTDYYSRVNIPCVTDGKGVNNDNGKK